MPPHDNWKGKFGKDHNMSKKIYQIKDGEIINTFYGAAEASRKTGIYEGSIRSVAKGRRKTAGKYEWRYADE